MTDSLPGFLNACARLRISFLDLPTAYWHELAYAVSTGSAALPAGVHTVVIGGEAALPERVDRWRKAVGTSVRLLNTYGPTEATVVATVADLHDPPSRRETSPSGCRFPAPVPRSSTANSISWVTTWPPATGETAPRTPPASLPSTASPAHRAPTAPETSYASATTGSCVTWAGRTPSSRSADIGSTPSRSRAPS